MRRVIIISGLALSLSGCIITPALVGTAIVTGIASYCVGITDAGKQAIRDKTTGGVPLIACPEGPDE